MWKGGVVVVVVVVAGLDRALVVHVRNMFVSAGCAWVLRCGVGAAPYSQ